MARYAFDWVDAFSDRPFCGNGCAVVHGGAVLGADICRAFTAETSLVECTFTGASDIADIRVRYFLAGGEIPFAGHPTIATVAALRARGDIAGDHVTLETGAGVIPVEIQGDDIVMTQPAPKFGSCPDISAVAATIGLPDKAILGAPQVVSTGLPFCITVLRDLDALRDVKLNLDAMAAFKAACGMPADAVIEPFLVALQGATAAGDTFARLLLPPPNPPEDAFTGSATGAMAAYLWRNGIVAKPSLIAEQGHWMGRPGQAHVTRLGPPEAIEGVIVAGKGYVLMSGDAHLPDDGAA